MELRRNQSSIGFMLALLVCILLASVNAFGGIQGLTQRPGRPAIPLFMSQETTEQQKSFPIQKTDEEWQELLTPDQYYILRKEGTETPGASVLNQISVEKNGSADAGTFCCAGCGHPLFTASAKYDSGTGWPSFYQPVSASAVALQTDYKLVVPRTEVVCSQCGGHLGHVFEGMMNVCYGVWYIVTHGRKDNSESFDTQRRISTCVYF